MWVGKKTCRGVEASLHTILLIAVQFFLSHQDDFSREFLVAMQRHTGRPTSDEFYIFVACSVCRQSTGKLALKETQPDVLVTSRGFEATLH